MDYPQQLCAGVAFNPAGSHPGFSQSHKWSYLLINLGYQAGKDMDSRILLVLLCLCQWSGFGEWWIDVSREQEGCVTRRGTAMPLQVLVRMCERLLPYVHMCVCDRECQCKFVQDVFLSFHSRAWLEGSESPCSAPTATQNHSVSTKWMALLCGRCPGPRLLWPGLDLWSLVSLSAFWTGALFVLVPW